MLETTIGTTFEAQAKLFAEFDLLSGEKSVIKLLYASVPEVEKLGGLAYRAEHDSKLWELHFLRSAWLQRGSYCVLCEGVLVAKTDVLRIFRFAKVTYSDGLIWGLRSGIAGTVVRDSAGVQMVHSSRKIGLVLGKSEIEIDGTASEEKILPILLILLHLTTHQSD